LTKTWAINEQGISFKYLVKWRKVLQQVYGEGTMNRIKQIKAERDERPNLLTTRTGADVEKVTEMVSNYC
jgi:hypothetical protein